MTKQANEKTVRQRNRNPKASTQRFLPIAEISNDAVVLKNGGIRVVLQVEALNFNLKSETEQQGIIAGYQSFMNTITFPVQIVIRSSKLNIDPYINSVRALAGNQSNLLLKQQMQSYATFVEKIVDVADIMQKRFYIVIPLDGATEEGKSMFGQFISWFGTDDSGVKAGSRHKYIRQRIRQIRDRINLIETGLHNVGLSVRRLSTRDLIELYYHIYNPETSQEQKLPAGSLNTDEDVL